MPAEITKECYDSESFKQIMGVLARRLQDKEEDWRHVYKSLLLLEYMSKHGPQKVWHLHLQWPALWLPPVHRSHLKPCEQAPCFCSRQADMKFVGEQPVL